MLSFIFVFLVEVGKSYVICCINRRKEKVQTIMANNIDNASIGNQAPIVHTFDYSGWTYNNETKDGG